MVVWKNLSPYTLVEAENPVFQRERRRLRWLKTPESLHNYNRLIWVGIPALTLSWWFIERINLGFRYMPPYLQNRLPFITLIVIVGVMFLTSFYTVIITVGRIHRQFHADDWQAIRMTDQPESAILAAKDAIAQIRAWPFVAGEIGFRIAFVMIVMVINFESSTRGLSNIRTLLLNELCWLFYGFVLIVGLACVFEAVLRMRVLVTWSTAIALQVRHPALALLTGFATVFLFHLSQVAVLGLLWVLVINLSDTEAGILIFIALCVFAAAAFYAFYIGIRRLSNNFVRRKAFAQD